MRIAAVFFGLILVVVAAVAFAAAYETAGGMHGWDEFAARFPGNNPIAWVLALGGLLLWAAAARLISGPRFVAQRWLGAALAAGGGSVVVEAAALHLSRKHEFFPVIAIVVVCAGLAVMLIPTRRAAA